MEEITVYKRLEYAEEQLAKKDRILNILKSHVIKPAFGQSIMIDVRWSDRKAWDEITAWLGEEK